MGLWFKAIENCGGILRFQTPNFVIQTIHCKELQRWGREMYLKKSRSLQRWTEEDKKFSKQGCGNEIYRFPWTRPIVEWTSWMCYWPLINRDEWLEYALLNICTDWWGGFFFFCIIIHGKLLKLLSKKEQRGWDNQQPSNQRWISNRKSEPHIMLT